MPTTTYTTTLDAERRISLRGDGLYDRYRVHHRTDGVIELRPEVTSDGSPVSARTLQTVERSMVLLDRGKASSAVDLSETFPDLGESDFRAPGVAVSDVPRSSEDTARRALALDARLAARGLTIERRGQGAVVTDGERETKLSSVSRSVSRGKLEARLGPLAEHARSQSPGRLAAPAGPANVIPSRGVSSSAHRAPVSLLSRRRAAAAVEGGGPILVILYGSQSWPTSQNSQRAKSERPRDRLMG